MIFRALAVLIALIGLSWTAPSPSTRTEYTEAMSVDIFVLPGHPVTVRWQELRERWAELVDAAYAGDVAAALLCPAGSHAALDDDAPIGGEGAWWIQVPSASTLGLTAAPTADLYSDSDFVEDYGRNLTPDTTAKVVRQLRESPIVYDVSSFGGRPRHEGALFVALASALALLSDGWVVVMDDDLFTLDVGIYDGGTFSRGAARF